MSTLHILRLIHLIFQKTKFFGLNFLKSPWSAVLPYSLKATMEFMGPLLFVGQVLMGHVGLMVNYVLVRHWNDVSVESIIIIVFISIAVQVFWVFMLSLGGNTTQQFGKVVASWKYLRIGSKEESTFMKKFRKSCRPIVIGLKGYIKLRRISACKYLYGYSRSTFRMMLTIR